MRLTAQTTGWLVAGGPFLVAGLVPAPAAARPPEPYHQASASNASSSRSRTYRSSRCRSGPAAAHKSRSTWLIERPTCRLDGIRHGELNEKGNRGARQTSGGRW